MSDLYPLNALTVIKLLQPDANSDDLAECEERDHPWLTPAKGPPIDRPLLRLWDKNSGSQPGEKWSGFMLARAQQQPLHDAKSRTESLKIHAKNDEWVPTPYISFSSSPKAIEDLAAYRKTKRRGRQWLTAINPGVREAKGLPVLDIGAEMEHYRILNPYPYRNNYYENHYICLWEVTPEEIVRKWKWKKLMKDNEKDWYEQIVLPAFQRHNDDPTDWSEWTDSDSDSADDSDSSDDSDSDSSDDSDSDSSSGLSEVAGFIARTTR